MLLLLALAVQDVAELHPLTESWLAVKVVDGRVEHHKMGQSRGAEKAVVKRLNEALADKPETWSVTSPDDPDYKEAKRPAKLARRTRGVDFAWLTEKWENNRAVNVSPDHAKEHWIWLALPTPMKRGKTYNVKGEGLLAIPPLSFDDRTSRSEALHVNLIGYATSGVKFGYLYQWMGDGGSLDIRPLNGKPFELISNGKAAFTGKLAWRGAKTQPETGLAADTPGANFIGADVLDADFSAFTTPGSYVLSVPGVGCSFPFKIGDDVYRPAFTTVTRALYHNRSGIELKKPYTEFERPAPHNPKLTPGFKLVYTKSRFVDWTNGDAAPEDKPAIEKGIVGPLEVAGFYQDAGDWDGYLAHLNVASCLLLAYDLAPGNFRDRELNIPESGNGVPDILDEAAWLPRFCMRLRAELQAKKYGTGGIGLRICGDHFGGDGDGVPSWLDVKRQWTVSGEDPWSTLRYAAVAAHLACALRAAGVADPEKVDWQKEAVESWRWALANTSAEDEKGRPSSGGPVRDVRVYAAAALFRLTGDAEYQKKLAEDMAAIAELGEQSRWGAWLHALGGGKGAYDPALVAKLRTSALQSCDFVALHSSSRRALRWGGHWWMPMLVGHQTTPWILEGMVGHALTKDVDPAKAKQYRDAVTTTADYVLGTNAYNMTWATGLGARHPVHVFHMDAWYNGKPTPHPGIIPYGPWKKNKDLGVGPWDNDWANASLHPPIDAWPGNLRWFENRGNPLGSEFTIHQTICVSAAVFGWLCGPAAK